MTFRLPVLGGLILVLAVGSSIADSARKGIADWPQFRGPNRDDHSPDTGLLKSWPSEGPPLVWQATGLGIGFTSVSVANGKIFTMGDRDNKDIGSTKKACFVIALDAENGRELWSRKIGGPGGNYPGPRCTPTIDGDLVYALGQFGDLVCLDASSGKLRWQKNLAKDFKGEQGNWNYTESPLIDGDMLVCTPGGPEASMLALNKKDGRVIWKGIVPGDDKRAGYSSIVIAEVGGIRQYVQLMSGGVVGMNARDGHFLWKYDKFSNNTANVPTPIVAGDLLFCSAGYRKGGALLKMSPTDSGVEATEVYYKTGLGNRHGGVVQIGDYIYADRDHAGFLYCADMKTGEIAEGWKQRGSTKGRGSVAITYADGRLYCRYNNGIVALVDPDPAGYKEEGSFKIPNSDKESWPHPVVIGGRLYLREKDKLWCYDVKQH